MPRGTYEEQRARLSRPEPKAAPRARVRLLFEANGGGHGAESVTADIRSGVASRSLGVSWPQATCRRSSSPPRRPSA